MKKTIRAILFFFIRILGLRKWFCDGDPTEDDWRNPFWRLGEKLAIKPEWSKYLIDLRIGFIRDGEWFSQIQFWTPVKQNFWNGIFTFNIYITKTHIFKGKIPFLFPKAGLVIRFAHDRWFQTGIGWLHNRGEFACKLIIVNWNDDEKYNPGVNAKGWEEGSV
jgi:hypothetical protein